MVDQRIPALSLWQPWAHAVVHLGKRIENREAWTACTRRGPFFIHASAGFGSFRAFDHASRIIWTQSGSVPADMAVLRRPPPDVNSRQTTLEQYRPAPGLRLGGIVGYARVAGVIRTEADFTAWCANGGDRRQRGWWFGSFALVLEDVRPIPFIRCRGKQGWFHLEDETYARAIAALNQPASRGEETRS